MSFADGEPPTAEGRFAQANQAYVDGDYELALAVLTELDREFPGNLNLLKALARTLGKLGRFDEAIALCDRLEAELGYLNAATFRARLERQRNKKNNALDVSFDPNGGDELDAVPLAGPAETAEHSPPRRRIRIKPVRLALLLAIVAGMYFEYVPYWLGGGLIALYVVARFALGRAFTALFSIPFKMKGKALAGATVELHGIEWTEKPARTSGDDEEDAPKNGAPLRYAWLDVTIAPQPRTQGFTHWEPGELMVAPSTTKLRRLDDMDKCFRIHEVKFVTDGNEVEDDEGYKVRGPQRLKLLAEFPSDAAKLQFFYYGYAFGDVPVR